MTDPTPVADELAVMRRIVQGEFDDEADGPRLAEWERALLEEQQRQIDAERAVIEAARTWRACVAGLILGSHERALAAAVDALPRPAGHNEYCRDDWAMYRGDGPRGMGPKGDGCVCSLAPSGYGADLHMTVRRAEETGDG